MNARARWALGAWLALLGVSAAILARTEFSADLTGFLPRSPSPAQQILVEQLRSGAVSRLMLLGIEGGAPETLARLSKGLAGELRQSESFANIANGEVESFDQARDFLLANRYLLSPAIEPGHFSAPALRAALEDNLELLASPVGVLVEDLLPQDPTGEFLKLLQQLQQANQPAQREGVWFSPDQTRALLVAQTRAAGFDIDAQAKAIDKAHAAFAHAAAAEAAPQARLLVSGPGVFSVSTRARIQAEAMKFSLIASVLVAALLLAVYRSLRVIALALLPVASGALVGVAAVSLAFGSVHGITLGFGSTLIGEGVDYAIYLFTQVTPAVPPARALHRIWPTLRLGVLTSICGFSAMLFSGFTGLAQLGLFSIVGLLVAVAVTRWVLPALLPARFGVAALTALAPLLLNWVKRAAVLRYPLFLLVALAALALTQQRARLWNDDLARLSPIPERDQRIDEELRRAIGAPDVRHLVVVKTNAEQQALEVSERAAVVLTKLVEQGVLAGFDAPTRYLPSRRTQRQRQQALPTLDALRANLAQALAGLPFQPRLFEPFLHALAAARTQPLVERASLGATPLALKLDALLVSRKLSSLAMLPLSGVSDPQRLARTIAALDDTRILYVDLKQESNALYVGYRSQALTVSLLGAGAIALLLAASLRSLQRSYYVLAPLAAAVVVTCALLLASGQQLNIFHLVALSLVIGVGSNYSLFFDRDNFARADAERIVVSLVVCNLCAVIGFGVLGFSSAPVLQAIGTTVGVGAFLSLAFAAVLTARLDADKVGASRATP